MAVPLKDFAAKRVPNPGPQAWVTTIPEFDEILEAWQAGVGPAAIVDWLREECGYAQVTKPKIDHYFQRHYPRG